MRTLHVAIIAVLIITPLVPIALGVPGTVGIADGVLRDSITSIKFLDAYFGTSAGKIEVAPGRLQWRRLPLQASAMRASPLNAVGFMMARKGSARRRMP